MLLRPLPKCLGQCPWRGTTEVRARELQRACAILRQAAGAGDVAGVQKILDAENPPGEWNRVEILAQGARYQVWINGKLVNDANGVEVASGPVGVQSEGGIIQFRRITLTPLD